MTATAELPTPQTDATPLVLFARLERAVEAGDHSTAAAVQQALAERGIIVRSGRPDAQGVHHPLQVEQLFHAHVKEVAPLERLRETLVLVQGSDPVK